MSNSTEPKILLFDLETLPHLGYTWGKWDQNVIKFKQETCIATYAAKWLNGPIMGKKLNDYPGYKPYSYDDKKLVQDLWKLLDEADIVVAHNGVDFDVKVARSRFLFHGMKPPSPFKIVDTKLIAKKVGRFSSNSLNDLGSYLGFGQKIKTDFDLWLGCISGEKAAWDKMLKYNKMDVLLLQKLYLRLLPWSSSHPNMTLYTDRAKCPKCASDNINYRGVVTLTTGQYNRFQCQDCGGWGRATRRIKSSGSVSAHQT